MKKKIGIPSFPHYHNYGTSLQLYALQLVVEKHGYIYEIITYEPINHSNIITLIEK